MTKFKIMFLAIIVALLMPAGIATADYQEPVIWWAEYFDNPRLEGRPIRSVREESINYDWGHNAPLAEVPADHFSVRWSTETYFEGGDYTFTATVDDGMRLWIDGKLVIDQWRMQKATTFTRRIELKEGKHSIQMSYFEKGGSAVAMLWWRLDKLAEKKPEQHKAEYSEAYKQHLREQQKKKAGHNKPHHSQDGVIIVDNKDEGFTWGGPTEYRNAGHGGYKHGYYWTKNSKYEPSNSGKWTPHIKKAGKYEVYAYIPSNHASTESVRYRILHNGERHDKIIDQGWYFDEWVSLGTYYFAGDWNEHIIAYDNTREAAYSTMIAFDAIKLVPKH